MKKILFFTYSFFLLFFTAFSYLYVDKNLIYLKRFYSGFAFAHRGLITSVYIFLLLVFFGFYFLFLKKIKNKTFTAAKIKKIILLTFIFLLFSYPAMLSYDIFNYETTAKVLYFYHENPYIVMPIEFKGDSQLLFTHAANRTVLYGPVWVLLTALPYFSSLQNFILNILAFKFLNFGFYLLALFAIWKISRNLFSLTYFALNPLIIIETFVSVHNDIVMMSLALLSLYFLDKRKILLSFFILLFSVLIKYATAFLLPVILYYIWKSLLKEKVNIKVSLLLSMWLMFIVFLISPLREEMYPWYAVWFFTFSTFFSDRKIILYLTVSLSFGLLLRYVPFMLIGAYFGPTPLIRLILTIAPVFIALIFLAVKKKLCLKDLYRI